MALFYSPLTNNPETVTYHFRFQVNGTSDPDVLFPANCGITDITRSGVGAFSVVFAESHPAFVTMSGSLLQSGALGASDAVVFQPVSWTASTKTLAIRAVDPDAAGVPAAADPDDDTWVCLSVTFCRKTAFAVSAAI